MKGIQKSLYSRAARRLNQVVRANSEQLLRCGVVLLCAGAAVAIWPCTHSNSRFEAIFFGGLSVSFALMAGCGMASIIPEGRIRSFFSALFGYPLALAMLVLSAFNLVGAIGIALILVVGIQFIVLHYLSRYLPQQVATSSAYMYVVSVVTLVLLAYRGPAVLIATIRLFHLTRYEEHEGSTLPAIRLLLGRANFRRRTYEAGFLVLVLATLERITASTIIPWHFWPGVKSIWLEAFLTFVAVDQYLLEFAPRLVKPKKGADAPQPRQSVHKSEPMS